jgi:hypothetical protein
MSISSTFSCQLVKKQGDRDVNINPGPVKNQNTALRNQ